MRRFFESCKHLSANVSEHLIALGIAAAISYIVGGELGKTSAFFEEYRWALIGGLFLVFASVAIYLRNRFSRNAPHFPQVEFDFEILRREIYYEFLSPTQSIYRRRYSLRACRDNLDRYPDQYGWTGIGTVKLRSGNQKHQVAERERDSLFQKFDIEFKRYLRKGEEITAEVIWELEDPTSAALPFASVTIHEPTDQLRIEAKFPKSFNVTEVICEHSMGMGSRHLLETREIPVNGDGRVIWEVQHPELLHFYKMRWQPQLE